MAHACVTTWSREEQCRIPRKWQNRKEGIVFRLTTYWNSVTTDPDFKWKNGEGGSLGILLSFKHWHFVNTLTVVHSFLKKMLCCSGDSGSLLPPSAHCWRRRLSIKMPWSWPAPPMVGGLLLFSCKILAESLMVSTNTLESGREDFYYPLIMPQGI